MEAAMPRRVRASARQLEFMAGLEQLPDVILSVKGGEQCAVNARGRFGAFEKHWNSADTDPDETLLALAPAAGAGSLTPSGEPRVHVHVDWNAVRWAIVRRRVLPLVGTDQEIVLCADRELDARITTFFVRTGEPLRAFVDRWGRDWIQLGDAAVPSVTSPFGTMITPAAADVVAPDGSDVRVLLSLSGGGLAHFELGPGQTSVAVRHRTVEEIWLFVRGQGEMWRRNAVQDEVVPVGPDVCVTIPLGTEFQFRSLGGEPLAAVGVTMPQWPGLGEAVVVRGKWAPSVEPGPH